jgi:hypothetical protein
MVNAWQTLPLLFLAAIPSSIVALCIRCTHRGPIGSSWKSIFWALSVIVAMSTASAGLAFAGPRVIAGLTPIYVSLALPFTLSTAKVIRLKRDPGARPHPALPWITAGIALLLDQLDQQMSLDKDDWATSVPYEEWLPATLEQEALRLFNRLIRLTQEDPGRKPELTACWRKIEQRVRKAGDPTVATIVRRRARNDAEQAFLRLRIKQYEWGYHGISPLSRLRIRAQQLTTSHGGLRSDPPA